MIRTLQVLAILSLFGHTPIWADEWTGPDKTIHLTVGALAASITTAATANPVKGFAVGCGVGFAKELYDSQHRSVHTVSGKDFAVTCLGAAIGASVTGWTLQKSGRVTTLSYTMEF